MRNFLSYVMMYLLFCGSVTFIGALVTWPMGNPFALPAMLISGLVFAAMFAELRWNPTYSLVVRIIGYDPMR
jgi:branched-subunit amino acid transport protein